ncbi:hypothetical protein MD484_g5119, partial [Candolleomyces efflorescens]
MSQESPTKRIARPALQPTSATNTPVPISTPETPRKRKPPSSARLSGLRAALPANLAVNAIQRRLRTLLGLSYTPDLWQAHLIQRLLQGYDSILCAGTGYGKSLIFEGMAALGGKGKVVFVICPLKALEHDQAQQACTKGLEAVVLNEDTSRNASVWEAARKTAALVYLSPEMALSDSFVKLWKDAKFRKRLICLVVDEAHCVNEWGSDDFRPAYRKLATLRSYTGQEVPFLACTATCTTDTFNLLWSTLEFGHRPFWGIDVGVARPNLLYHVRQLVNKSQPILDILNILPKHITTETELSEVSKSLLYFDSESMCRTAADFLRKCLPTHLRSSVHAFSSDLSEQAKQNCWKSFLEGRTRILCATDAAGMGCNVPDVEFVVSFGIPKSLGTVFQRWGRGGRDRQTKAVCILLVPSWAFRPLHVAPAIPSVQKLRGAGEPKQDTLKRMNLADDLEHFINLSCDVPREPNLDTYHTLADAKLVAAGSRSRSSPFDMSWTVLDLDRTPSADRCCWLCNPALVTPYEPCHSGDARLRTFAKDFTFPLAPANSSERPPSSASTSSSSVSTLSAAEAKRLVQKISRSDLDRLREQLVQWRDTHFATQACTGLSIDVFFPPKQLNKFIQNAKKIIQAASPIGIDWVRQFSPLDLINDPEIERLANTLSDWRESVIAASATFTTAPKNPSTRVFTIIAISANTIYTPSSTHLPFSASTCPSSNTPSNAGNTSHSHTSPGPATSFATQP